MSTYFTFSHIFCWALVGFLPNHPRNIVKNDLRYVVYARATRGLLFITDWQKHDFITIYYKVQI